MLSDRNFPLPPPDPLWHTHLPEGSDNIPILISTRVSSNRLPESSTAGDFSPLPDRQILPSQSAPSPGPFVPIESELPVFNSSAPLFPSGELPLLRDSPPTTQTLSRDVECETSPLGTLAAQLLETCPEGWASHSILTDLLSSKRNRLSREDSAIVVNEVNALFAVLVSLTRENRSLRSELDSTKNQMRLLPSSPPPRPPPPPPSSYARVLASNLALERRPPPPPPPQQTPSHPPLDHALLVYPLDRESSSKATEGLITRNLNPRDIRAKVKKIRGIGGGGIKISCGSPFDVHLIADAINAAAVLKETLVTKIPVPKRPRVILYGIDNALTKEGVKEALVTQNEELEEDDFRPLFTIKGRGHNQVHWVMETSPGGFHKLMSARKVFLGWKVLSIKEYLKETRCFNCCGFGHVAKFCSKQKVCTICSRTDHTKEACVAESPSCHNCSLANARNKTTNSTSHSVLDRTCPQLKRELEILKTKIQYQ